MIPASPSVRVNVDNRRDPIRARLMQIGVFYNTRGINEPFVPITPDEREQIVTVLEREVQDMVCTSCGCTKSQRWLKAMGAMSCCEARNMVPAEAAMRELAELRAADAKRARRRKVAP